MKKTIGSVVLDSNPPYRSWDGNQATYLFFPVFVSFFLVLLAGLSDPIIKGLSVVNIDSGNGTVRFGAWGWCARDLPGFVDQCSSRRAIGAGMEAQLAELPLPIQTFASISTAVPGQYLVANGVFHILSAIATWATVTWTLAASGSWQHKERQAYDWTQWAFAGNAVSAVFVLIAWGLDLGVLTRVQSVAIDVDGSQPKVTPGPAIWMMMTAFLLNLFTFLVRVFWLKYRPRPLWTIKGGGGDFHSVMPPPMSDALQPPDEQPPTWESLGIDPNGPAIEKEVAVSLDEKPSIGHHGFAVQLSSPRDLPDQKCTSRGKGMRETGMNA